MSDPSYFSGPNVLAAVDLGERSHALVECAARIARGSGKKLLLVHAIEHWQAAAAYLKLIDDATTADLVGRGEERACAAAEERLAALAKAAAPDLQPSICVVRGRPREVIPRTALDVQACLIVVGIDLDAIRKPLLRGFSTAASILATADVPVLAVDPSRPRPGDENRILVCDDLTDQSEDAVTFALHLATALRGATVQHVHVSGLDRAALTAALDTAAATSRTPPYPDVTVEEILAGVRTKLEDLMDQRVASELDYLEASGGTYQRELREGDARAELDAAAKRFRPTLVILGRHRAIHREPFFLGRVPMQAMFGLGAPLLVVPHAEVSSHGRNPT